MTKNSELNDPIIPWLDLSAYGLCLFKLDSTAQGKHWIVVSGDIEQHGETLACLGLRRSARGVMFLPVIGDRWKLTPEWKRAFPELTIKPMPVSQVVVQAVDPVVVRSETVAHPVATLQHAAPESPGLTDGAKIAGGTSRVRRTETAAVGSDAGDRSAEEPRTATPAGESGDRNGRRDAAQALTPAEAGAWFGEIALAQRQAGLIRTFELLGAALTNGDLDTVTDILSNTSNRHTRAAFVDITGMSA